MPPIFVVGADSVAKQRQLEQLREEKLRKERARDHASRNLEAANRALDRYRIEQAREIKTTLRRSPSGPYNEYDKADYSARLRKMKHSGDTDACMRDAAAQDRLLTRHRAAAKPRVAEVTYVPPSVSQLRDEVVQICATTVESSVLDALEQDPVLGDWVRQGLKLHQDRTSTTCLFCEQALGSQRLASLEAHFSTEYDRFLARIEALVERLVKTGDDAKSLPLADPGLLYDDLSEDYRLARDALAKMKTDVHEFVSDLVDHLERKRSQPFARLEPDIVAPDIDLAAVTRANDVIRSHNQTCDDFQSSVEAAGRNLADAMVAASVPEHTRLEAQAANARAPIHELNSEIEQLDGQIGQLAKSIVEHRRPAEELNEDLHRYLGHDEVRLDVRETGYVLTRRDEPARWLSEGETTALALLYFLKSLGDRSFDMTQGVVVLDDPVSSLDANSLYLASSFIRERTRDAGQLFLLTHNFTFFREIRHWFRHLPGQNSPHSGRRPARFYMLESVPGTDPRRAVIRALDPLLENFESEYHYLFWCVYSETCNEDGPDLARSYLLPNVARRLLEMFLAFRRPKGDGNLWGKMRDLDFDSVKTTRILRFVNAHSHGEIIGEPAHDPSQLGEARAVLADLLEFMRAQDPDHVSAMIDLVDSTREPGAAPP